MPSGIKIEDHCGGEGLACLHGDRSIGHKPGPDPFTRPGMQGNNKPKNQRSEKIQEW